MQYTDQATQLEKITEDDFKAAKAYFAAHPNQIKWRKSAADKIGHSFLKDKAGNIYALAKEGYLGIGGLSKVKLVKRSDGKILKVKISPGEYLKFLTNELQIIKDIHPEEAEPVTLLRKLTQKQQLISPKYAQQKIMVNLTSQKSYTITEAYAGENLRETLPSFSKLQQLYTAYLCCLRVKELHAKNYLHRDLKLSNFIVDHDPTNPLNIHVKLIDFNYAKKLNADGTCIDDIRGGTKKYLAPELAGKPPYTFSKQTDYYALSRVLRQLDAPSFSLKMRTPDKRDLNTTLEALKITIFKHCIQHLKSLTKNEPEVHAAITSLTKNPHIDFPLAHAFTTLLAQTAQSPALKRTCQYSSFLLLKFMPEMAEHSHRLQEQYQHDVQRICASITTSTNIINEKRCNSLF